MKNKINEKFSYDYLDQFVGHLIHQNFEIMIIQ